MKCINCKVSMFDKPLSRTNPVGQPDAGWMCQDCIKNKEPELYKNLKNDGDLKTTNDIFESINKARHPQKLPVMRSCCPSNDFEEGEPSGKCWGDGHYLCQSCKWYRADLKLYGQEYIDGAHNAQAGLQFSVLRQHDA